MPLPKEDAESLAAQAVIGLADIEKARQQVKGMEGPVKYLDGKVIKTVRAEKLKGMWEAELE